MQQGPLYGYFPNARKTWLVVKPEQLKDAEAVFVNTGVQITAEGRLCLDAPLGQPSFVEGRVDDMVNSRSNPGSKKLSALLSFRSVIHKLHIQHSRMVWLVAGCMLHEQSMTWSQALPPLTRPFDRLWSQQCWVVLPRVTCSGICKGALKKIAPTATKKERGGGSTNAPHCARSASDRAPFLQMLRMRLELLIGANWRTHAFSCSRHLRW